MGDSITWGTQSTYGDGYRLDLLNLLSGNPVKYIGSQHSGTMGSNDNSEGYPGYLINEIAGNLSAHGALTQKPNLVLIMAGTNDINRDIDVDTAPGRLGVLIDEVITACPDAAILVAEITPILNSASEARAETFNAAIPLLTAKRVDSGSHVLTVNMSSYLTAGDLIDGLHPSDEGYAKMANAWFDGIQKAADKGWIQMVRNLTAADNGTLVASQTQSSGSISPASSTPTATKKPSSASRYRNDSFCAVVVLLTVGLILETGL